MNESLYSTLVSFGLSPESAKEVRIERIINSQQNIPARIKKLGFYDYMFGKSSRLNEQNKICQVYYEAGWKHGIQIRNLRKESPWFETEIKKVGSKWEWVIFREGYYVACGYATSQIKAEKDAFSKQVDLV